MSDRIDVDEDRWVRDALRAEVDTLPVRLTPEELALKWNARRRVRMVRRLQFVATVVVAAVVGLGLAWSIAPRGAAPVEPSAPVAGPVLGGISVQPSFAIGPGLSTGRATLTLTEPQNVSSSFPIGCTWSVSGHVLGLAIGKQQVGSDMPYVRWQTIPGSRYEIELVEADRTSYVGGTESYASHAAADGRSGTITFTKLALNSGAPTEAPRSGWFEWTCEMPAGFGAAAPSLPVPAADQQGIPVLWIIRNGQPERRAFTGCPITMNSPAGSIASSCATTDWWESLPLLSPALTADPGDKLAFALSGWTVTRSEVYAARSSSPGGTVTNPEEDLQPSSGNAAIAFRSPGGGSWFVHFIIEASKDDGSSLQAEYACLITVP